MKVKELIEKLQRYPDDMEICGINDNGVLHPFSPVPIVFWASDDLRNWYLDEDGGLRNVCNREVLVIQ